jgi:hypothetical protein
MNDLIGWLTAILAFITAIYAWLTYKILQVMRKQSEDLTRPYITIQPYIIPNKHNIYLKIHNTGKTAAENLKLVSSKNIGFLEKNIAGFPPGMELVFHVCSLGDTKDFDHVSITATYESNNKKLTEETIVDLTPYDNHAEWT